MTKALAPFHVQWMPSFGGHAPTVKPWAPAALPQHAVADPAVVVNPAVACAFVANVAADHRRDYAVAIRPRGTPPV